MYLDFCQVIFGIGEYFCVRVGLKLFKSGTIGSTLSDIEVHDWPPCEQHCIEHREREGKGERKTFFTILYCVGLEGDEEVGSITAS